MSDRLKNILIGSFVLSAIIIAVSIILFLEPKIGDGKNQLTVSFSNVNGISEGTRVTFAGKPVGEVDKIEPVKNPRKAKADSQGDLYYYEVILKIDSSVQVYDTDEITVQTVGLMGEKMIAIIPKKPPEGVTPKIVKKDQIIYAESKDNIQIAMKQVGKVAKSINHLVKDFNGWFCQNSCNLSRAASGLAGTLEQSEELLTSANQQQIVSTFKETLNVLNQDLLLVYNALDEFEQRGTWGKLDQSVTEFNEAMSAFNVDGKQILQNINVITQDLADGSGTIGKLIKSDDLYLRVTGIMSKVNTLMNDLNHYGLLFQYDKHWQRSRTKRANILEALDTPKEFRNYFEKEMDTMTTSLARLDMLMQKAETPGERKEILSSEAFKKDFSTLLRQVKGLSESLKLFNEDLLDQEGCECN